MNIVSVTGRKWILKKVDINDTKFIKENFLLDEITSKLLSIRNIDKKDINNFLNPLLKNNLPNPNILKDMNKAVERTYKTIVEDETIGIFGDYDVDGATSTALLSNYFKKIKRRFEIYIPDRKDEGYGPNIKGFKKFIDLKIKLIFTVDCGTLSFEPIKFAKSMNIDVLILDHHQSEIKLPEAYSVVNPNRIDDVSNLNYLCAAGVCFMFLIALNKKLRDNEWFTKNNIVEPNLLEFLDLVSLGTICDVVPLVGLNRAIVNQGLKVMKFKKNLGLKTLIDMCEISSDPAPYHLGYVLGPRINAGGRVGKCSHGAKLLINNNPKEAFKIALELNEYNKERQSLEKNLLNQVLNTAEKYSSDPVLVLHGNNWHEGVIGIVAARLKDKFKKPTIIISVNNDLGKASARSIFGFDIGALIIAGVQNEILIKGGGHKMAGGFSIKINKIQEFKDFIFKKFRSTNIDITKENTLYIDLEIAPSALNLDFYSKINKLSPFGSGNPEPRFFIKNVRSINSKIVGDKHIKSVLLSPDGTTIDSIAFNASDNELGAYLLKNNKKTFNIVGKLSLNEWKGKKKVEFIIDDISVNKNN